MTNTNRQVMIENFDSVMASLKEHEPFDPLAITEQIEIDIELSTGGPADGFKIYVDKETREPLNACYYYLDKGWYEEKWLLEKEIDLVLEYFGFV